MDVTLHEATSDDLPVVKNLVPYYIYDMSEHMGLADKKGVRYTYLTSSWTFCGPNLHQI